MWYAVARGATGELISIGSSVVDPLPDDLIAIGLDHEPDLSAERWNVATRAFEPRANPRPRPRLRITADKSRIWARTPGQPPSADQMAVLTGQLLDAKGQPDPTATLQETVIDVPRASGQPSLFLIRATAGVIEISSRGQWSPSIPFATETSGRYDMAAMLGAHFEVVEAPVIEVLRG